MTESKRELSTASAVDDVSSTVDKLSNTMQEFAFDERGIDSICNQNDGIINAADDSTELDDTQTYTPCSNDCTICCALPFQRSPSVESEEYLLDDASAWDWDGGLYGLACQMQGRDQVKLPPEVIKSTVESTKKHLRNLKIQLMDYGLQKHFHQNYCGESISSARVIAPLELSELELGNVLGVGGFSSVSEISSIRLQSRSSRGLQSVEDQSRKLISKNVILYPEKGSTDKGRRNQLCKPCTQYAVKHLRTKLITRTPDKFKRAAIDLVLEGQLLLVLDHPNIVGLRGWSAGGPDAFSNGDPRSFFLILDKLPVSLEDRMFEWRASLLQYQKQFKRQNVMHKRGRMVSSWAKKAIGGKNKNVDNDKKVSSNKANIPIQKLLLERLRVAQGIARAIQYIHSKRMLHRDLKVANVGFDVYGQVKLFDLGLSRLLPPDKVTKQPSIDDPGDVASTVSSNVSSTGTGLMSEYYVMSRVGTKFYMAPEVRRKEPYSRPADVYSFGVILWEILTLSTPRDAYHYERDRLLQAEKEKGADHAKINLIVQEIKDGNRSWLPMCPCWPKGLHNLVTSMLYNNSEDRPTMDEVLTVLQQHIDALLISTSQVEAERSDQYPIKQRRQSKSRIDLSQIDLKYLNDNSEGYDKCK